MNTNYYKYLQNVKAPTLHIEISTNYKEYQNSCFRRLSTSYSYRSKVTFSQWKHCKRTRMKLQFIYNIRLNWDWCDFERSVSLFLFLSEELQLVNKLLQISNMTVRLSNLKRFAQLKWSWDECQNRSNIRIFK